MILNSPIERALLYTFIAILLIMKYRNSVRMNRVRNTKHDGPMYPTSKITKLAHGTNQN